MRPSPRSAIVVALLCAALGAGCGGKKRPPVTAGAPGSGSSSPSDRDAGRDHSRPLDDGRDVRPVDDSGSLGSSDFAASDPGTGEGGPLSDVLFDYDSAALSDAARAMLEKHALWLQNHRPAKVLIEGHCDERGTAEYNLALGTQRAEAVRAYLERLGVGTDRMRAVSLGKERPLDPGHDEAAWVKNRRGHFVVSR